MFIHVWVSGAKLLILSYDEATLRAASSRTSDMENHDRSHNDGDDMYETCRY
jgi:hypothetical protein